MIWYASVIPGFACSALRDKSTADPHCCRSHASRACFMSTSGSAASTSAAADSAARPRRAATRHETGLPPLRVKCWGGVGTAARRPEAAAAPLSQAWPPRPLASACTGAPDPSPAGCAAPAATPRRPRCGRPRTASGARLVGGGHVLGDEQRARFVVARLRAALVDALGRDLVVARDRLGVVLRARRLVELRELRRRLNLGVDAAAERERVAAQDRDPRRWCPSGRAPPWISPSLRRLPPAGPRRGSRPGSRRRRGARAAARSRARPAAEARRRRNPATSAAAGAGAPASSERRPSGRTGAQWPRGRRGRCRRPPASSFSGAPPAGARLEHVVLERADEAQLDVPQLDDVAGVQLDALVVLAVDAHAVGALQIDDGVVLAVANDLGVVARDRPVREHDVVFVRAADDHRRAIERRTPSPAGRWSAPPAARRLGRGRIGAAVAQGADRDRRLRVGDLGGRDRGGGRTHRRDLLRRLGGRRLGGRRCRLRRGRRRGLNHRRHHRERLRRRRRRRRERLRLRRALANRRAGLRDRRRRRAGSRGRRRRRGAGWAATVAPGSARAPARSPGERRAAPPSRPRTPASELRPIHRPCPSEQTAAARRPGPPASSADR